MRQSKKQFMKDVITKFYELDEKSIITGVRICFLNAMEFIEELKILLNNMRYSHSFSYLTMALEEFGKGMLVNQILIDKVLEREPVNSKIRHIAKALTRHIVKYKEGFGAIHIPSVFDDNLKQTIKNMEEYFLNIEEISEDGRFSSIFQGRNENLYVDFDIVNEILTVKAPLGVVERPNVEQLTRHIENIYELILELEEAIEYWIVEYENFDRTKWKQI